MDVALSQMDTLLHCTIIFACLNAVLLHIELLVR